MLKTLALVLLCMMCAPLAWAREEAESDEEKMQSGGVGTLSLAG